MNHPEFIINFLSKYDKLQKIQNNSELLYHFVFFSILLGAITLCNRASSFDVLIATVSLICFLSTLAITGFFMNRMLTKIKNKNSYSGIEMQEFSQKMQQYLLNDLPLTDRALNYDCVLNWMNNPCDTQCAKDLCDNIVSDRQAESKKNSLSTTNRFILKNIFNDSLSQSVEVKQQFKTMLMKHR